MVLMLVPAGKQEEQKNNMMKDTNSVDYLFVLTNKSTS